MTILPTLPAGQRFHPPSSYPARDFFERSAIYPALVFPAKRTGEIKKALSDVSLKRPKMKGVYAAEEGVDYVAADLNADGSDRYDPKKERKMVLKTLGPASPSAAEGTEEKKADGEDVLNDLVFQDPKVKAFIDGCVNANAQPGSKAEVRPSHIKLPSVSYSTLTVEEVLRRILPSASSSGEKSVAGLEEIPSSFESAGHVAHVNLRDEALPYKYLVGKAILEKNTRIRTVVNKVGNIENVFRTYPMEILAGEGIDMAEVEKMCTTVAVEGGSAAEKDAPAAESKDNKATKEGRFMVGPQHEELMQVELKEHGCRFRLDFAKVYWNSRLQGEHARLVEYIVADAKRVRKSEDRPIVVADAMAGVGPFAVPLTAANASHAGDVVCSANDLNPVSYKYLLENARANRCFTDRLMPYNMDGRAFIQKVNDDEEKGMVADHFIMNLPQSAPEFLDAFRGWKFPVAAASSTTRRPMVHVHCFGDKGRNMEETKQTEGETLERCGKALGCSIDLEEDEVYVRVVRDVGPRKNMLCVSFRLPLGVAELDRIDLNNGSDDTKGTGGGTDGKTDDNGKRGREEESEPVTACKEQKVE